MQKVEHTERELPLIQRGIVDSYFEEGHYEYGISVLDRLRSSRYKPYPLHVRQLVFIALYPPPPEPCRRVDRSNAPPQSPQKVRLQRQKDDLWPKPTTRPLSIALLNAFVETNTPESLMRALPYYQYVDNHGAKDVDPFRHEKTNEDNFEDNSPLKDEIKVIQQQKDCWDFLKDGFVKRKQTDRHNDEEDHDLFENAVVGSYAWPVLEWLILIFEKDQSQVREQGQAPYSALLLCQIPPPRSKNEPRWNVEIPLKVAFACFLFDHRTPARSSEYESSQKRMDLGARLILLLVNLTSTKPPLLSPSHLLRSLVQRLPELPVSSLEVLLSTIPPSQASFKLSLLECYISQETGTNSVNSRPGKASTARLIPRVKPKFIGKGSEMPDASSIASAGSKEDKEVYPMSSPENLMKLLASPLPSIDSRSSLPPKSTLPAAKIGFAKLQMISVLLVMCVSHQILVTDSRWISALCDGTLRQAVQAGFVFCDGSSGGEIEGDMVKGYLSQALDQVHLLEACKSV